MISSSSQLGLQSAVSTAPFITPFTQPFTHRAGLQRLGFWGRKLSLNAIIVQHTIKTEVVSTILVWSSFKLEKNGFKDGTNMILCSDLGKFWKSTRTHQYSYENLIGMFYGVHRYSRKKNSVRWSMVRFWPCSLFSGLLALIFFTKNKFLHAMLLNCS